MCVHILTRCTWQQRLALILCVNLFWVGVNSTEGWMTDPSNIQWLFGCRRISLAQISFSPAKSCNDNRLYHRIHFSVRRQLHHIESGAGMEIQSSCNSWDLNEPNSWFVRLSQRWALVLYMNCNTDMISWNFMETTKEINLDNRQTVHTVWEQNISNVIEVNELFKQCCYWDMKQRSSYPNITRQLS